MIMAADVGVTRGDPWAIVLAGGGGSRLRGCTVDSSGHHVPKQYCLVDGSRTLLQLAVARAKRFADPGHVMVVVSSQHREWWKPQLAGLIPSANIVAQPLSRGTTVGVLLPLMHVLARDPEAHLVLLPADHYFRAEERLTTSIRRGLEHTYREPSTLALIGVEPDVPTPDFGYIVPLTAGDTGGPREVASFVEKPPRGQARQLIAQGALWNTLILAARGQHLLLVIRNRFPHTVDALRFATTRSEDPDHLAQALSAIFRSLTIADFSKDVLEPGNHSMVVVSAADVGWAELGTPTRVLRFWDELQPGSIGQTTTSSAKARTGRASLLEALPPAAHAEIRLRPPS
jgi:mannose-1-phosphate guanylyltransferase